MGRMRGNMKHLIVLVVALVPVVGMLLIEPIAQPEEYHAFADRREIFGVENFWDVVSNVPFVLVGILGLGWVLFGARVGEGSSFREGSEKWPWGVIFFGTLLTGFGSGYYHMQPDSEALVWDRLPMTLVTMPLLAAMICERISVRVGLYLLWPFVIAGVWSVYYWAWTEGMGRGDLRPYALAQFLPLLLIPLILWLYPRRYTRSTGYLGALAWYVLAKLAEEFDALIFGLGGVVSGHTLKHIFAAMAIFWLWRMLRLRRAEI